jgi:O-acetylhomoserine (thiol)-lyase
VGKSTTLKHFNEEVDMSENHDWSFDTQQIHSGQVPDPTTGSRSLPIYQTTAYQFRDTQHAANLFGIAEAGNVYTRINNPTQDAVEKRLAVLEHGKASLLVASGMAATTLAIMNVAEAGDHVVASPYVYGGTYNLGVALDLEGIANIAHEVGVPWIVDNTIATPYVTRPIDYGVDIVTHSATKFLSGHGSAMVGAIIDSGNFDFAQNPDKFPGFNQPDPSYNNMVYAKDLGVGSAFGNVAYIFKCRLQLLRDMGPSVSPFNAWLLAQGLETLSMRMERHLKNSQAVAEWLADHPQVESVSYSGLPNSPWHTNAKKYAARGAGAVMAFDIKGGLEAGKKFVEGLTLFSHVANIGDVRSLVIHPASTTHSQLGEEGLRGAGITSGTVRLSIGVEDIADIIADLQKGFIAAKV